MRVNPNDYNVVSQLQRGQFAFPDISFSNGPLQRTKTTLLAAYTTITNCGLDRYLDDLAPTWKADGNTKWQNGMSQIISDSISQMIAQYHEGADDELLTRIFIRIQLWGGNTGRGIFARGKGFQSNFRVADYEKSVAMIDENLDDSLRGLLLMNQVGLSFATKHLFFWGENLPILDERISMLLYGKRTFPLGEIKKIQLYRKYVNHLDEIAATNPELTRLCIERSFFNWMDTFSGQQWYRFRKNNAQP